MSIPNYMTDRNAVLADNATWRSGEAPNYDGANETYLAQRTVAHEAGSLPDLVTNLVKNWEKEMSYKTKVEEIRTIDKSYLFSCNGGEKYTAEQMLQMGTYNALIGETAYYSAKNTDFEESHRVFRESLGKGFAWEALEVYSGPPVVAFKWRHWGQMTGQLRCPLGFGKTLEAEPNGKVVELFGICVATLTDDFKIKELEIFYNPDDMMSQMLTKAEPALSEPIAV